MTIQHHISAVRAIIANGPASDDLSYSDRLIAHFLQVVRATLIERKADKYRMIADQTYQSVCITLESSTFHNCCNVPNIECYILKSTIKIPDLLSAKWGNLLQVTDLAGNVISEYSLTNNKYATHGIITPKTGWFIHDGHLYIINNKKLEKILVSGLFVSPTQINQINCATGDATCDVYGQEEFPIDADLVEPLYKMVLAFLLQSEQLPNDSENNAKSTETTNAKQ